MTSFTSRAYAGSADLNRLIDFAQKTTGARWPRSTYMKAGDVVWTLYGSKPGDTNIRLWFDSSRLAAYALFEPPLTVDFDIRPGASPDDSLADEILRWAEERRRNLGRLGTETIPKAYAMLGENTLSTKALDSDPGRVSLLNRNGYSRTDRFHVLYSRSLVEAPIAQPDLDAGLRLRHTTDADLDARVDVHRDAWSVWGKSKVTVETYRRLRSAPISRSRTRCCAGKCRRQISQLLHRMARRCKRHRTFRAGRLSSGFRRTRIRPRRDYRGIAPDAGAWPPHRSGRYREHQSAGARAVSVVRLRRSRSRALLCEATWLREAATGFFASL